MKKYPASIKMYIGPMYSGKSTSLKNKLAQLKQSAKEQKDQPSYYRFTLDKVTTPKLSTWKTHGGVPIEGHLINHFSQIECKTDHVLIDEIQFAFYHCSDQKNETEELDIFFDITHEKYVYLAGLNLDWQDNPFQTTSYFTCIADEINVLKARCHRCDKEAKFTEKITQNQSRFDEASEYLPICQNCRMQTVSVENTERTIA